MKKGKGKEERMTRKAEKGRRRRSSRLMTQNWAIEVGSKLVKRRKRERERVDYCSAIKETAASHTVSLLKLCVFMHVCVFVKVNNAGDFN